MKTIIFALTFTALYAVGSYAGGPEIKLSEPIRNEIVDFSEAHKDISKDEYKPLLDNFIKGLLERTDLIDQDREILNKLINEASPKFIINWYCYYIYYGIYFNNCPYWYYWY